MARTFRYFEKKRGHRRTGSKTLAIVGETVFFTMNLPSGDAQSLAGQSFVASLAAPMLMRGTSRFNRAALVRTEGPA